MSYPEHPVPVGLPACFVEQGCWIPYDQARSPLRRSPYVNWWKRGTADHGDEGYALLTYNYHGNQEWEIEIPDHTQMVKHIITGPDPEDVALRYITFLLTGDPEPE